jgi:hypothetical protein
VLDTHIHHHVADASKSVKEYEPALTILLAEVKEHAENIRARVHLEQMIFNYSVVLLAATVPVSIQIVTSQQFTAFFVFPWVFCALAILVLRQDLVVACVAKYMYQTLYPKLRSLAQDESVLRLEVHLRELRGTRSYLAVGVARYFLFFIPSVAAIAAAVMLKRRFAQPWQTIDWVFLGTDLVVLATCLGLVSWLARSAFFRITDV